MVKLAVSQDIIPIRYTLMALGALVTCDKSGKKEVQLHRLLKFGFFKNKRESVLKHELGHMRKGSLKKELWYELSHLYESSIGVPLREQVLFYIALIPFIPLILLPLWIYRNSYGEWKLAFSLPTLAVDALLLLAIYTAP